MCRTESNKDSPSKTLNARYTLTDDTYPSSHSPWQLLIAGVLPIVIQHMVAPGLKGLLVAGLMAAAISTFDSTVNAASAYYVKDIYQAYLKPEACVISSE